MANTPAFNPASVIHGILKQSQLRYADAAFGDRSGLLSWCSWRRVSDSGEGHFSSGNTAPPTAHYLTASLTKPITALVIVQLAAQGCFFLNEPVRTFLPDFRRGTLRTITLRHLLTHTSGLPDMLPNNDELRAQHATITDFADALSQLDPAFQPGTNVSYCSMGFAVLDQIARIASGKSLQQLCHESIFQPLGLRNSWLGLPLPQAAELLLSTIPCELPPNQPPDSNWHWNSHYWRTLGAPWGGLISTAADLGEILAAVLNDGRTSSGTKFLSSGVVRTAVSNQTQHSVGLAEQHREHRAWGYGWRLNWPDHSGCFSDLLPANAFGHWGATGTLMWADPNSNRWAVVLTNQPYERSQQAIQRISNVLAGLDVTSHELR